MASPALYQIVSGTNYALSIDGNNPNPGGGLILWNLDSSNPHQQWQWIFYPAAQASILYNPGTGLFAAPQSVSKGAKIVLYRWDPSGFNGNNTWQIVGGSNGSRMAVRPPSNTDLNLNAFGDNNGPSTPVGLWDWGGGDGNEVWTSTLI